MYIGRKIVRAAEEGLPGCETRENKVPTFARAANLHPENFVATSI